MTQRETIKQALALIERRSPHHPLGDAIVEVLRATEQVKDWEAAEGDESECECEQCVATTSLAFAIIKEEEGQHD